MRKNILGLAIAAALSLTAVTQTAQAVNIANNGVGEIAYIPYYNTNDGRQNYVRLVNNGFDTLIVKLKVREGQNSVDLRDFYIVLSPRDVWTANVYADANGVRLHTLDTSCTVPSKKDTQGRDIWQAEADGWSIHIPSNVANPTEGYIVAQVAGTSMTADFNPNDAASSPISYMAKHVPVQLEDGRVVNFPRNCPEINTAFEFQTGAAQLNSPEKHAILRSQFTEPTNALSAQAALVNPAKSTLTAIPVTVLANVVNPAGTDGAMIGTLEDRYYENDRGDFTSNDIIYQVATDQPDEKNAFPLSAVITNTSTGIASAIDADQPVSAAMMHSSVMNNIDTTGGGSWIVTFPTKKHHQLGGVCSSPFPSDCQPAIASDNFLSHGVANVGAISYVTNEEESSGLIRTDVESCFSGTDIGVTSGFSGTDTAAPSRDTPVTCEPIGTPRVVLPYEVNVVTFGANPLASGLETAFTRLDNIQYGWMQMRFQDTKMEADQVTLYGLPVIGFGYSEYNAGSLSTMGQAHTYTSPLSQ